MTPRGNWQALCMGTPPGQGENGVSDLFGAMIRDKIGVGAGAFNARPTGKKEGNAGAPNGEGLFRSEEMVRSRGTNSVFQHVSWRLKILSV
ncbi:hypothetical protein ACFFV8_18390 [Sphingobium indicum]|uniref:hypothetical protein n=1 Tax=Sphingobium TaxID=165695 RepID=UPI00040FBF35|nr:hypothetical protein [Sphingobium sp. HDIP04]